jgi:hypothetical protein
MARDPNRAPEAPAESTPARELPTSFYNNAIVALVGLPLYFTAEWKVCTWARWPLFGLTVLAVLACGINPLRLQLNGLIQRAYRRKGRPGKPAVLVDQMVFDRFPADSGWSDPESMKPYEGEVVSMGYLERDAAGQEAPYTAFRFRKRKDGHIESLIAVKDWDYPNFHRISLPQTIAALLYGTRHAGEERP